MEESGDPDSNDVFLSDETEDEDSLVDMIDEVDGTLTSFGKYCNAFIEKYGSRKRAIKVQKDGQSPSTAQPDDDGDQYDFSHASRGLAVIINNTKYRTRDGGIHRRTGSNKDATNLEKLFRYLGFVVKRYDDLTKNQMLVKLQKAASNTTYDHGQADCFACAILAHGSQADNIARMRKKRDKMVRHDVVYGVDWRGVPTKYLLGIFNDKCCPELQGKPRLFFIQACRGNKTDDGTDISVLKAMKKRHFIMQSIGTDVEDAVVSGSESDTESDSEVESDSDANREPSEDPEETSTMDMISKQKEMKFDPTTEEKVTDAASVEEIEPKCQTENKPTEEMTSEGQGLEGKEGSDQLIWESKEGENRPVQLGKEITERDRSRPVSRPAYQHSSDPDSDIITVSPAPIFKDYLLVYAAPPGYFAWRNKTDGGWMIQALKSVLMSEETGSVSFSKLLTQVCWKVAKDCASTNRELNEKKLVPCVLSMLTKDIYFRKKSKIR